MLVMQRPKVEALAESDGDRGSRPLGRRLGRGRRPGLAGLGDLVTTCISPSGRNRSFGERIGRGQTI